MKIIRFALIAVMTALVGLAAQPQTHPMFLQWSERAKLKSADGQFQIEVHPILTDEENHSPVVIRRLSDGKESELFTLTRAAYAMWSPDSHRILVIDEPTADNYEVHLYSPEGKRMEADTDGMMRSAVVSQIAPGRKIEFYLPTFLSWKGNQLVIAVGGTTSHGIPSPMESFCLALSVDSDSGKVLAAKKLSNSHCQLSP
ncbi:MAG TPA: hypothetical protein VG225_09250 [Terracidiphilus sp.]|jgi:hypothetical protein|nr:hypothetical protein [Terracidiphilus sp.]